MTTERSPLPLGMTPPGWPSPERMAAIMEAIGQRIEEYRAEFDARERREDDA